MRGYLLKAWWKTCYGDVKRRLDTIWVVKRWSRGYGNGKEIIMRISIVCSNAWVDLSTGHERLSPWTRTEGNADGIQSRDS